MCAENLGLRVAFVGEPLRLNGHDEFLLEVHSGSALWSQSWRIQRRWSAVRALHDAMCTEAALPCFPKVHRASQLFRSRDDFLMERGQKIEVYLNTVLAIPGIFRCGRLYNFLEVPSHPQQEPPIVEHSRGSNAPNGVITVTLSASGGCHACRRLCDSVCGLFKGSRNEDYVNDRRSEHELDSDIARSEAGFSMQPIAEGKSSFVGSQVPASTASSVAGTSVSAHDLHQVPSCGASEMSEEDLERRSELQLSSHRATAARQRLESMKKERNRGRGHVNSRLGEELLPSEMRPGK